MRQPVFFKLLFLLLLSMGFLLEGCGNNSPGANNGNGADSADKVLIGVDETYKPIVEQFESVFEMDHPDIKIEPEYNPEIDLMKSFFGDKAVVVITSRKLSPTERSHAISKNLNITEQLLGYDAIAIIVNKSNPVKKMDLETLKKILTGKIKTWAEASPNGTKRDIIPVFDNPGSGTVRFLKDSLLNGGELTKVYTEHTTPGVIKYVGETESAIGFIGVSWLSGKNEKSVKDAMEKIDLIALQAPVSADPKMGFYQPMQTEIKQGKYPLSRSIYSINRENSYGPGTKFVSFIKDEVGQRIILKAGLLPERIPPRGIQVVEPETE